MFRRLERMLVNRRLELIAVAVMASARAAVAQVDPFEFEVYPAQTVGKGMIEIEHLNSFVAKGHTEEDEGTSSGEFPSDHMYRTALEVTYGGLLGALVALVLFQLFS